MNYHSMYIRTCWAADVEYEVRNADDVGIRSEVEREFVSVVYLINVVVHR